MSELIELSRACEILGISIATGRNWVRLGKLVPSAFEPRPVFSKSYIESLSESLVSEFGHFLKSRRNKSKISGNSVYRSYIMPSDNSMVIERIVSFAPVSNMRAILANLALQLVLKKSGNLVLPFSRGELDAGKYTKLVKDLLGNEEVCDSKIYDESISFVLGEDTLGLAYISLRDIGKRKSEGVYYTPYHVVKKLVDCVLAVETLENKKIFDPCCGTGNFLIHINHYVNSPYCLFGQDTDEISVAITRINIALNCNIDNIDFLFKNFTVGDTLVSNVTKKYDVIIGNPPWGSSFTKEQTNYLLKNFHTASNKWMDSSGLFVEKSLMLLNNQGLLAFVLPQALLSVRSHERTRQVIQTCSFDFTVYLENAFSGVLCPSVILGMRKDGLGKTSGCMVTCGQKSHVLECDRFNHERFMLDVTDEELACLNKMKSGLVKYLKNNAVFALGIVTGDNSKYIKTALDKGLEPIFRGNDVYKYHLREPSSFIEYVPAEFQQVADERIYRTREKLFYRFISDTLIFAYDGEGRLSLNSCNVLIPKIDGMSIKYVMAVLNSRAVGFFFKKSFGSVKVLRSHLESIPIPCASYEIQLLIEEKTDLITGSANMGLCSEIDDIVYKLYGFTESEKNLII